MATRLLFLDRDGTLNKTLNARPPNTADEVELLPRTREVLARWVADGWKLVVITNQGGVASGYLSERQAREVLHAVVGLLGGPIAADYLCPHVPGALVPEYDLDCPNRKPKPGSILDALQRFDAQAHDCLFVGDAITDQQAAQTAGVPFQWADRFFGRPINRGLHATDGQWVQIRQVPLREWRAARAPATPGTGKPESTLPRAEARNQPGMQASDVSQDSADLYLSALRRGRAVGWLTVMREHTRGDADLALWVGTPHQGVGIDELLMQAGIEWAGRQRDLHRLCVRVPEPTVPFAKLCCRFGFSEQQADQGADHANSVTMVCYL